MVGLEEAYSDTTGAVEVVEIARMPSGMRAQHTVAREIVMLNWKRLLLSGAAVAMIVPGLAMAEGVKRGGTITIARADEALTLDPFIPSDNGSIYNIAQVCEPLIVADATGTGLEPGLAESWAMAKDGLSIMLKIRSGVKFSNGNPLTVEDAIFSLQKVSDPKASYGFAFDPVKSIEKV